MKDDSDEGAGETDWDELDQKAEDAVNGSASDAAALTAFLAKNDENMQFFKHATMALTNFDDKGEAWLATVKENNIVESLIGGLEWTAEKTAAKEYPIYFFETRMFNGITTCNELLDQGLVLGDAEKARLKKVAAKALAWGQMKNDADDSGMGECLGIIELCKETLLPKLG